VAVPPDLESDQEGNGRAALIKLRNVIKTYSNAAGDFTVLKGINLDFCPGEFVAVIGKSGSGKSTLLNMVTGIDRPTSGEIYVGDVPVHQLSEGQMSVWRGRHLGIVFQFFQLLPMLSLVENVMLPMDFCNVYRPGERRERAVELLRLVEMEKHADKLPTAISGGQQQRVAIARALANDPPIVLADEPTGNLDSKTAESIFNLFEQLSRQGKTIVMVTHDTSQARRVSRTVLLADGEIVNEYVACALPSLTHQQMLWASRQIQPLRFEPGTTIIQQDVPGDRFYIITRGWAEVALHRPWASDVVVARLGEGQYFGEVALLHGGRTTARVRASREAPVEVLALERDAFRALMERSEPTRDAVGQVARYRVADTDARRDGKGPA
jgi:ABC-type lipoprotein export system ATPase subunit